MKYRVAYAGLALACLYMTVLGFDNITTGKGQKGGGAEVRQSRRGEEKARGQWETL